MADITSANVTHTEVGGSAVSQAPKGGVQRQVTLVFGDGALTYPLGGVPLDKAKLGCPTEVTSLDVIAVTPTTANPLWVWNGSRTAPKLVGYEIDATVAGDTQLIQLDAADTPVAQTIVVEVTGY